MFKIVGLGKHSCQFQHSRHFCSILMGSHVYIMVLQQSCAFAPAYTFMAAPPLHLQENQWSPGLLCGRPRAGMFRAFWLAK